MIKPINTSFVLTKAKQQKINNNITNQNNVKSNILGNINQLQNSYPNIYFTGFSTNSGIKVHARQALKELCPQEIVDSVSDMTHDLFIDIFTEDIKGNDVVAEKYSLQSGITRCYANGLKKQFLYKDDMPYKVIQTNPNGVIYEAELCDDFKTPKNLKITEKDGTKTEIMYGRFGRTPYYYEKISKDGSATKILCGQFCGRLERATFIDKDGSLRRFIYDLQGKNIVSYEYRDKDSEGFHVALDSELNVIKRL
ncbi:MAG: hypothetical protein E7Z91_02865 [Cyanobacteria bacterium SIG30]|nr:hypothetical protein [Cyanobacteria bacterium SIG30]